ncbi:MAG: polyketide cyclase [Caldilineae bacterium]|nr:MAG: polyketide cyclase [Caldilineae bacterium]
MPTDIHSRHKQLIVPLRAALYDADAQTLPQVLQALFSPDCAIHLAFPLGDLEGPDALYEQVYLPLLIALPDLERRDFIFMAGEDRGQYWIGCAGHYLGVFARPWLDIPPTRRAVAMRYHEFFRIEDERIVEMQAVWDIPQLMMQAGAWPMTPSLGTEWLAPAPATQDGLRDGRYEEASASVRLVRDMLTAMGRHPLQGGPEVMHLERFWHPRMNWYGPAGIGTARGIDGFRRWHQIPFLKAMPDRRAEISGTAVMFGEGPYVATTGWPNMRMTISGDGWLGIAPCNRQITMRSLDFWRIENGLIRENWVLIDLLHVYHQIGVDVFLRMRELTYHRQST